MEDIINLIKSQSLDTRDLFVRYSKGKEIGFYPLSQSKYSNYFTLIPYLLDHKEFNFRAGEIRVNQQTGFFRNQFFRLRRPQVFTKNSCSPVLPHDSIVNGFAGFPVPDNRCFALIGNSNCANLPR